MTKDFMIVSPNPAGDIKRFHVIIMTDPVKPEDGSVRVSISSNARPRKFDRSQSALPQPTFSPRPPRSETWRALASDRTSLPDLGLASGLPQFAQGSLIARIPPTLQAQPRSAFDVATWYRSLDRPSCESLHRLCQRHRER